MNDYIRLIKIGNFAIKANGIIDKWLIKNFCCYYIHSSLIAIGNNKSEQYVAIHFYLICMQSSTINFTCAHVYVAYFYND